MRFSQFQKPPLGSQINWAHPLAKGLVGCWIMQEGSGNRIYDLSGNGNVGTLTNMDGSTGGWTPGRGGPALKFDGTDDYVDVGNRVTINSGGITISTFIKSTDIGKNKAILSKRYAPAGNEWANYGFYTTNDVAYKLYFFYSAASLDYQQWNLTTTASELGVLDGKWHHLVVSFTYGIGSSIKFYIDNVSVSGSWVYGNGNSLHTANDNERLIIGATFTSAIGSFMAGSIDDVRIYNRALSAQEVMQLYLTPYAMFERRPVWMDYVEAAGGLSIPVAMHHYNRLRAA